MRKTTGFLCAVCLCIITSAPLFAENALVLLWPIDRPRYISGAFGEYRGLHFHNGIDIGCQRTNGYSVFACASGYVSEIRYQHFGIGYAVIVTHPNGATSLYGHLGAFSKKIMMNKKVADIRTMMLDRKDFSLKFDAADLPVSAGEVIAFSGNTGLGGVSHLHFELQDKDGNMLNPLVNGMDVSDSSAPVFTGVTLVPLDGFSYVDGKPDERFYSVRPAPSSHRNYVMGSMQTPVVSGRIGVRVNVYDTVNSVNKVSVYAIDTRTLDKTENVFTFDTIKRKQTFRVGLVYDIVSSTMSSYNYYVYSRMNNAGVIDCSAYKDNAQYTIIARDAKNNRAALTLNLVVGEPLKRPAYKKDYNLVLGKALTLKKSEFRIEFPEHAALYNEEVAIDRRSNKIFIPGLKDRSKLYAVLPENVCIDEPAMVYIEYDSSDWQKVGVYTVNDRGIFFFAGNKYNRDKERFELPVYRMGKFFLMRDDVPPTVSLKRKVSRYSIINLAVSDVGSGIDLDHVTLTVDGETVVWDYNPNTGCLEILVHNKIWKKGTHEIQVQVADRATNLSNLEKIPYTIP